jgi:hypothetical protein
MNPGRVMLLVALAAAVCAFACSGAYADYSRTGAFAWGGGAKSDKNTVFSWPQVVRDKGTGLPKVVYDGVEHWNALTVSLFGLQEFDRYVWFGRKASLRRASRVGDWLVRHQSENGAWMYQMTIMYPRMGPVTAPWVAAQAQGNAISLLVRLYHATHHRRYLSAARRARRPFERPVGSIGVRREFEGHVFFEGFPTIWPSLTLEDFQLSILGLYDVAPYDRAARRLWREGMRTLVWALPLYELDEGETDEPQFDLGHRTLGPPPIYSREAHEFNARLLKLLAKLSGDPTARHYARRWLASLKR